MASTHPRNDQKPVKPFPTRQMFILALCRICEPISFTSIFPYIYQMIDSFGITDNKNEIGIYAGMVTSAFAFAEFSTGMMWGRLSDRIGRKPVLIGGLVGTLISNAMFGFAKSFPIALLARALGGGLNGNIGVIQTTVAEIVREKEHQPRAFAIMPFIWCLGSIIGPSIGGLLAEPTHFYPNIFPPGGLLEEYPYLLPNMVASIILVLGILNGILFLEESHDVLKHKRDYGRELGQKILSFFSCRSFQRKYEGPDSYESPRAEETDPLLDRPENNTAYSTSGSSSTEGDDGFAASKGAGVTRIFTRPVVAIIISYGILAYHGMGFEQNMPVFLSTPRAEYPHHFIKFTGGLGMNTQTIGFILSMQGIFSMIAQFFFFPPLARYFGVFTLYRFVIFTFPLSYIMVPYLDFLPEFLQLSGIYFVLAIKIIWNVIAYPCNAILLTNSTPSLLVLGVINGIAASSASFARTFSPTITGMIYSAGLDIGVVGLSWWCNALVCVIGGLQCLMMRREDFEGQHDEELEQTLGPEDVERIAVKASVRSAAPITSAEVVVDDYGLVVQAVDGEIASLSKSYRRGFSISGRSIGASIASTEGEESSYREFMKDRRGSAQRGSISTTTRTGIEDQ